MFTVVLIMKVFMVFLVVCVGRVTCVDVIVLSLFSVILAIAVVAHVGDCALALVFVACAVITPCVFVVCCNRMWLRPIAPACGFQPPPPTKNTKSKMHAMRARCNHSGGRALVATIRSLSLQTL